MLRTGNKRNKRVTTLSVRCVKTATRHAIMDKNVIGQLGSFWYEAMSNDDLLTTTKTIRINA